MADASRDELRIGKHSHGQYPSNKPGGKPSRARHEQSVAASKQPRKNAPKSVAQSKTGTDSLSEASLARLNELNEKLGWNDYDNLPRRPRNKVELESVIEEKLRAERPWKKGRRQGREHEDRDHNFYRERRERIPSGPLLEKGYHEEHRRIRRVTSSEESDYRARKKRRRKLIVTAIVIIIVVIIAVAVGVSVSKNNSSSSVTASPNTSASKPANGNLNGTSQSSIPLSAQGTYLDPFTWYDTTDFNVTYTAETFGGLPVMGLNSTWDDSARANSAVPALRDSWAYGSMPIRGVNLGGWLSVEPFITPSLFNGFDTHDNVIDEYTLSAKLGPSKAAQTLEQHYSSMISKQSFADIQAAGFDHVRISYPYWAVTTYDDDPYVPKISWRYLLRGIEWARSYGLRVNLDLHGVPGSQNGWNHSGRQGPIGWLNGTDGELNAQRSIDIHKQLSTFFAQPRYKNVITMYGLVNEPRMVALDTESVLNWTQTAINTVRASGMPSDVIIVIGDGFLGLANWQGKLQSYPNILLDAHQYVIFNVEQIALAHSAKLSFACDGWTQQTLQSSSTDTGFGNFLCGEWSQADTDCTIYLNDVGVGSRWEGTLNTGNVSTSVLSPTCPTKNSPACDCDLANAKPSTYSDAYKQWLLMFAEAQMHSYEKGWGWFYWTWDTESATQWSYKQGMAAGILPTSVQGGKRSWDCGTVPDFASMGLSETY